MIVLVFSIVFPNVSLHGTFVDRASTFSRKLFRRESRTYRGILSARLSHFQLEKLFRQRTTVREIDYADRDKDRIVNFCGKSFSLSLSLCLDGGNEIFVYFVPEALESFHSSFSRRSNGEILGGKSSVFLLNDRSNSNSFVYLSRGYFTRQETAEILTSAIVAFISSIVPLP